MIRTIKKFTVIVLLLSFTAAFAQKQQIGVQRGTLDADKVTIVIDSSADPSIMHTARDIARYFRLVSPVTQACQSRECYIDMAYPLIHGDFVRPPKDEELADRLAQWKELIKANDASKIAAYSHYGK